MRFGLDAVQEEIEVLHISQAECSEESFRR